MRWWEGIRLQPVICHSRSHVTYTPPHIPFMPTNYILKLVCVSVGMVTSWWITESTFAMFESAPNKAEWTHPQRMEDLMVRICIGAWGDSQVGGHVCICVSEHHLKSWQPTKFPSPWASCTPNCCSPTQGRGDAHGCSGPLTCMHQGLKGYTHIRTHTHTRARAHARTHTYKLHKCAHSHCTPYKTQHLPW